MLYNKRGVMNAIQQMWCDECYTTNVVWWMLYNTCGMMNAIQQMWWV